MQKEDALQIAVATYLNLQYPNVLWCHVPNGGSRNAIEGAKFKKMGVKPGVSDILIFEFKEAGWDGRHFSVCGLAIELKIKPNKPTPEQLNFMERLRNQNWVTGICYTFDEAKLAIDTYLT
jgi:hypothetical protein